MLNDKFVNVQEIDNELKELQVLAKIFELKFSLLNQILVHIFSKIKECETLTVAQEYFEVLEKMQSGLACLLFQYNIKMPDRLDRFVRDFDNLEAYKEYYFAKIISGEYFF